MNSAERAKEMLTKMPETRVKEDIDKMRRRLDLQPRARGIISGEHKFDMAVLPMPL